MNQLYNLINVTNNPGLIDVFDADTKELLFVMGSENMLNRCKSVDGDHRSGSIKHYTTGWSPHRVEVAKQARMLLFVGKPMPELVAKSTARQLDKFSKSKQTNLEQVA